MQTSKKDILPLRGGHLEPAQSSAALLYNDLQRPSKRARVVKEKHSYNACLTCRQRKLKCDGERPCQRCVLSKRRCGYNRWEIAVESDVRGERWVAGVSREDLRIAQVSETAMNQMQALAHFIGSHYQSRTPASPFPAHQTSFLHFIARHSIDLPLLPKAVDALCIGHLSRTSSDQRVVYKAHDSQRQLLLLLQRAIAQSKSSRAPNRHKDILASILVLSLIPSSTLEDGCSMNSRSALSLHFKGAMQYLQAHGPAVFDESDPFDLVLVRHVRMQGLFQCLSLRTRALWSRPGWKEFDNMPFAYIPGLVMSNFVAYLPGLLERADAFMASDHDDPVLSANQYSSVVNELNDLQTNVVQPWITGPTCTKPDTLLAARECKDYLSVDVRQSLADIPLFTILYDFSPSHGSRAWCNVYVTLLSLVGDCTVLQLMYNSFGKPWTDSVSVSFSTADVERRAYAYASEICRYVHFFGSRSLPALVFMVHLLRSARNFFECVGTKPEARWCSIHIKSLMDRVARLRDGCSTYMLCPVGELIKDVPPACYYKR